MTPEASALGHNIACALGASGGGCASACPPIGPQLGNSWSTLSVVAKGILPELWLGAPRWQVHLKQREYLLPGCSKPWLRGPTHTPGFLTWEARGVPEKFLVILGKIA